MPQKCQIKLKPNGMVLVYRFTNDHGKITYGYLDDGDYGVGRKPNIRSGNYGHASKR